MSLENFIQENRPAFEQDQPSPSIWEKIAIHLDEVPPLDQQDKSPALGGDALEAYVRGQRAAFDTSIPPSDLEAALFDRLEKKPGSSASSLGLFRVLRPWILRVAAVLLLLGSGWWAGRYIGHPLTQQDPLATIRSSHPDFPETAAYYQQRIDELSSLVYEKNPDPRLAADLAAMDQAMEELRRELPQVPREQQAATVAELIKTYRIKLQILQNILALLPDEKGNGINQPQHENDEI